MSKMDSAEDELKEMTLALQSTDTSVVHQCLVKLREDSEGNLDKMKHLAEHDAVKQIVFFLKDPKLFSIALKIIDNCCSDSDLRKKVLNGSGALLLTYVIKGPANDEIKSTACCAVSKLAVTDAGLTALHKCNSVDAIVNFLETTGSVSCKQMALEALAVLARDKKKLKIFVESRVYFTVSELLCSGDDCLSKFSVKTMAVLTQDFSIFAAMQIRVPDVVNRLCKLYYSKEAEVSEHALTCLYNINSVAVARKCISDSEAVEIFINIATGSNINKAKSSIIALCCCCRDLGLRNRIRQITSARILVKTLTDLSYKDIHGKIVATLTLFFCQVEDMNIFRDIDVVPALVERLRIYSETHKTDHRPPNSDCEKQSRSASPSREVQPTDRTYFESLFVEQSHENCDTKNSPSESQNEHSSEKRQPLYSIHSPTYQGLQYSESPVLCSSNSNNGAGFTSPISIARSPGSPDRCPDFSTNSPLSYESLLSPWSPSSSSVDDPNVCWSPVLSSRSNSPDSVSDKDVHNSPIPNSARNENTESSDKNSSAVHNPAASGSHSEVPELPSGEISQAGERNKSDNLSGAGRSVDHACDEPNRVPTAAVRNKDSSLETDSGVPVSNAATAPNRQVCLFAKYQSGIDDYDDDDDELEEEEDEEDVESDNRKGVKRKLSASSSSDSADEYAEIADSEKDLDHNLLILLYIVLAQVKETQEAKILIESLDFRVLMQYLTEMKYPRARAIKILGSLITNHYVFDDLIARDFFGEIDKIMVIAHNTGCARCSRLQYAKDNIMVYGQGIAESMFGLGTLEQMVLGSKPLHRLRCMYAVSRVVSRPKFLEKLLLEADGLSSVFEFLHGSKSDTFEMSASILARVYYAVGDKFKVFTKGTCSRGTHCKYAVVEYDIEFALDDGAKVSASATILTENSPYFCGLLKGFYIESTQKTVSIPCISSQAFMLIMHFIHGCDKHSCPFLRNASLDEAAEAVVGSERFLVKDCRQFLEQFLGIKEAPNLYTSTRSHCTSELSDFILAYIFETASSDKEAYIKCVQKLVELCRKDFFQHLVQFFKARLCSQNQVQEEEEEMKDEDL